jgi:hypothetical protein
MKTKSSFGLCLGLLCAFLTGCASSMVDSTMIDGQEKTSQSSGVSYHLPKGVVKVLGVWNASTGFWDITAAPVFGPDPDSKSYRAERHKNAFFDDDLAVAADPTTGLLQTVNGTTTDQRANAVASLAAASVSAFGVPAVFAPAAAIKAESLPAAPKWDSVKAKFTFSAFQSILDPTGGFPHRAWVRSANTNPPPNAPQYVEYDMTLKPNKSPGQPRINTEHTVKGILVREPIPYTVQIGGYWWANPPGRTEPANDSSGIPFVALQQTIMLPDIANDRVLPISRRPLVQDGTKVTLSNGMIQSREEIRPSMVNAVVGIPKTILGALVPIPGQGGGGGGGGSNAAGAGSGAGNSGAGGSGPSGTGPAGQTGPANPSPSPPIQ